MSPNDAEGMANNVDPDQTAPVCPGICVRNLGSLRPQQLWSCQDSQLT